MSQLEVDKIIPQSGTTLTIGDSGDTISLPSGVSLDTLTITGDLTVDTDTLYVDSTNNNVGIGTTTPSTGYGGTISNVKLALRNDGSGGNNGTSTLLIGGDNNHYSYLSSEHTGGGATYLAFGTAGGASNPVERMRIDSSGNVGIGTTSPTGLLTLNAVTPTLDLLASGIEKASILTGTGGNLAFYTGGVFGGTGAERMRIDSSGNLSLGTTTADSNVRFNVERKSGAGNEMNIGFTSSGTIKWRIGSVATDAFAVYNAANVGMYMSYGATSWTATSDERLKNITSIIENALDAISTLRAVKFTWISDENNVPQVGLIAQDVQQVLPEVISEDTEGYLGVRYTETIPLLVAAIQEQQEMIKALRTRIETLENT